ncbi:flagellar biosynthesis protein FlhF [Gorillibacterium timonense]|uniref:flagellar biosynthesis protein FlhF n=1 Tax=Gorillibacterium timonense TaxID=1689269 RepID=UPI00071C6A59|nr:flagellar biosynthesis protein FlhF [Gorillibacterium timonense]
MRVKRYVVDTMPEALQRIRSELGNDAVILSTKDIRTGGFLGLFGKKRIEVVAATDTPETAQAGPAKQKPAQSTLQPMISVPKQSAARAYGGTATSPKSEPLVMPHVPDVLVEREVAAAAAPVSTPAPAPVRPTAGQPNEAKPIRSAASRQDSELMDEIRQMKEMMRNLAARGPSGPERHPIIQMWAERLEAQDLSSSVMNDILGSVEMRAESDPDFLNEESVKEQIRSVLLGIISGRGGTPIAPDMKVVNFVGPTGVGKTTTIAKLAADQVLRSHRKTGFITADTYRIAAVEQLKTYATILNVPMEVVFSPADLQKAFDRLDTCEVIFMDTAGRNYRNERYVSELNTLLQARGGSETILVLSLTNKYSDMKVIADHFLNYGVEKVLFTKWDETGSYGAIINLLYEFPLHLTYVTNGQNVPEDIQLLSEELLVDWIMGDKTG